MRISIFGIGYVGAVSAACFAEQGHNVIAVDINPEKVAALNEGRAPIIEAGLSELIRTNVDASRLAGTLDAVDAIRKSDVSIVCVGTPSLANGSLDLGFIVRTCETIGRGLRAKSTRHTVIVRSTMLPGSMGSIAIPALERYSGMRSGLDFGIAYYPEFLREGSAIHDHHHASVVVIGVNDDDAETILRDLIGRAPESLFVTDFATAEAVKYANNAWHAAKIVFANEIGNFCKVNGVDSFKVMEIVCADRRLNISSAYMRPGFAFGGSCLPKDVRAVQYQARSKDLVLPMLESLTVSNSLQVRRAYELIQSADSRRVGLLGLVFKEGTDDVRESPAVELAELLFGRGYQLRIFDRNVHLANLLGANLNYVRERLPHLNGLLTTDLDGVVDFGDTVVAATSDFGGRRLPSLRQGQVLIDLVRLKDDLRPSGGVYQSLC